MDWQVFLTSSDPNQRLLHSSSLRHSCNLLDTLTQWTILLWDLNTEQAYEFLSVNFLYISYGILSPWGELGWSERGRFKTTKKVSEIFPMSFLQDSCSTDSSFFLTVTFILTKMDGLCDLLLPPTPTDQNYPGPWVGLDTLAGYWFSLIPFR